MSVTYGFFNSINHDRQYDAEQFSAVFDGVINDGVYASQGDHFVVTPGTGLTVNVGSGRAWFNHTWTLNDATLTLPITTPDIMQARIDCVYLEVDHTQSTTGRRNAIKVKTGMPASNPVKPTLVRENPLFQYPLAWVRVPPLATSISAANIENNVGISPTPFVTGILSTTNIDTLWAAWDQAFNDWFTHLHNELDSNQASHLQSEIDTINTSINSLNSGKQNNETWSTIILSSSRWSNSQYSLESTYPSSSYDIIDILPLNSTPDAQRKAWAKADCGGHNDTNVIVAKGTVPTIDISLGICVRKKGVM